MEAETPPADLGRRAGRSPRDMALSLAVLLVPIALLVIFNRVVLGGEDPKTVDPAPAIQQAQSAGAFPVAVPATLGDDWHATTATFRRDSAGATLRIGYVAPDDDALQLVESSIAPETLVPAELGDAPKPQGTVRDSKRAWRLYQARPGEGALVATEPGRTLVVVGNTDVDNLKAFAAGLS